MPRAKRITEQLKLRKWSVVLAVAHEPEEQHNKLLGWKTMEEDADWLTEEYAASVLKLVAHRLGVDTVTQLDYREEREKLLTEDRKRWLHGHQLLIPKHEQIAVKMGSWPAALQAAGLKTPRERGATRDPTRAPSHVVLLDDFWRHYKVLPTKSALLDFARGNDIPYPEERKTTFGVERDAWADARRAEGEAVPDKPPPQEEREDYSRNVGAAKPGERRRKQWTNPADCVAAVRRYLEDLPPNQKSSADSYRAWARTHNDSPAPNELRQHGSWTTVRKLAQDELQRDAAQR